MPSGRLRQMAQPVSQHLIASGEAAGDDLAAEENGGVVGVGRPPEVERQGLV